MSSVTKSDRVIILDRDGTIVIDRGYLGDPDGLEFEPGAAEALRLLETHGYRLVVITNQSGVGRGLFPLQRVHEMNARLETMVLDAGAHLEAIYFCPHAPDDGCVCRKPAQGLMANAVDQLRFDPTRAVVIGDKESDIEFGRLAGAMTILISAESAAASNQVQPDGVAPDLLSAVHQLIATDATPRRPAA